MSQYLLLAVLGLGSAAAYSLLSTGLVLIYRASGVLNFAQGAFAMAGAFLFFELRVNHGMAYIPAVVVTVLVISAVGCLVYLFLIARLREASVVVRVIATIGLMLVLQSIATLKYGGTINFVPESLPHSTVKIGSLAFPQDRLWLIGISMILVVIFTLISSHTRFGVLTRAVAENERASAAYGNSPRRIAALNWSIGSGLAALAGVLIAPISSLSSTSLTLLVVPAMAVALFGGFSSFPLTFLGAVIVGVAQGVLTKYETNLPGLSDLVPLALVVVVLVVRRQALPGRGELLQRLPSLGLGNVSPLAVLALFAAATAAALLFPMSWSIAFGVSIVAGIVLLSIVVLTGYAGQLSLGQYALAGIGALVAAQLDVGLHWAFPLALVCGVLAAAVVGAAFGLPSLRSRGAALAIVTLSLGVAVNSVIFNNSKYSGGEYGFSVNSLNFFGIDLNPVDHPRAYTIFCLCWFAIAVWVVRNLRHSAAGRRLISIRTNERAAAALGINVGAAKLYAFSVSAALAGLGGILLAFSSTSILLSQGYDTSASANAVTLGVVGGVGFLRGAVAGGQLAPGGLPGGIIANHIGGSNGSDWLTLVGGVLLLVTLLFNQNGLGAAFKLPIPQRWRRAAKIPTLEGASAEDYTKRESGTLVLRGVGVRFGGVKALNDVDLTIRSGQVTGLIGPNGAGKTTLIDAVTGYVSHSGEILARDTPISSLPPYKRARLGVIRGFQSLELFDDISVDENIRAAADSEGRWAYLRALLPMRRTPLPPAAVLAIREFGIEADLARTPRELSYGRRKLVAIARSVAASPDFLLLDEPAAGLGEDETRELGILIRKLADDWNIGILLIEHDVNLIMNVSDNVAVLDFGVKIAEGAPAAIRSDPSVIAAYLGQEEGPATPEELPAEPGLVEPQIQVGAPHVRASGARRAESRELRRDIVSSAAGASLGYDDMPVVRDLDISVHKGEIVALLGPNGAGKTTTVLSLAGALKPLAGEITFNGSTDALSLTRRAKNGLAYLAEERSVFMSMTVLENLRVAGVSPAAAYRFFPELQPLAHRRVGLLSGGEQQMMALSAVLAREPSLILADELSLGLAPIIVDRLLTAIRAAADEQGTGVLLVEQHVSKALQYADYVYVLQRGRVVLQGTAEELRGRADELSAAYLTGERAQPTAAAL